MTIKPSYKKAAWISQRASSYVSNMYEHNNPDNVLDVLLGYITEPQDFVSEVLTLSTEYDEDFRRHNAKQD